MAMVPAAQDTESARAEKAPESARGRVLGLYAATGSGKLWAREEQRRRGTAGQPAQDREPESVMIIKRKIADQRNLIGEYAHCLVPSS